jgi:hypothetical protein
VSGRKRQGGSSPQPRPAGHPDGGPGLLAQIAILVAVVVVVTLIAELAGAANLGVSLSLGTIAFTIVLMYLILKR